MLEYGDLAEERLAELLEDAAKLWLAHDGLWFQAVEAEFGLETAIRLDEAAMARFTVLEARRIQARWGLGEDSGLKGLAYALQRRLYAHINRQEMQWQDPGTLILSMRECRVQAARERKGMPPFPCRSVGLVEYQEFAREIDARITTRCLSCPPQRSDASCWCAWEFTLTG